MGLLVMVSIIQSVKMHMKTALLMSWGTLLDLDLVILTGSPCHKLEG